MSALAAIALLANLHGAGPYVETSFSSSWNDRLGLVARGGQVILEAGAFVGNYRGSYGFGTFWQFGGGFSWEPIRLLGVRDAPGERRENRLLENFYHPHLSLGRGAELFRVGLWWKMRLGPVWSIDRPNVLLADDASWGVAGSLELAGVYNTGPVFSLGPRLGLGLLVDSNRTAYSVNLGVVFRFQIPVMRVKTRPEDRADYWEEDY